MVEFIYEFQYAIIIGLIVGLICPCIGTFIVARRLSVIGEVLSNMSLSGIAIGSLLGSFIPFFQIASPQIYGAIFSVIGALLVEWLRKNFKAFSEISIPILLSFGIGLSVVIFSAMNGLNINFQGYLFGNLLAVNKMDLITTIVIGCFVLAIILLFYKELLAVTFYEEYEKVIGIPKNVIQFLFIIIIALTISTTVRAVGAMLVSGLMVLPVATSLLISKGFKTSILFSIIFSETAIIIGIILSYQYNLASGGSIILVSVVGLLLMLLGNKVFSNFKKSLFPKV
jgi:zinc transport system permease protein